MENIEIYINYAVQLVALLLVAVGVLATLVGIFTQVLKNLPGIEKLPTDVLVFALSLAFAFCAVALLCTFSAIIFAWYLAVAALVVGVLVAFISMFGWSKLHELWERNKKQ